MRDFRKIEAWQLADDLAVAVHDATKAFPKEELYGITSQMRRAVTSAAANIVEGGARESANDYVHFLQIARGSLAETQYFLHLARRLSYLDTTRAGELEQAARRVFACLHGLMQAVRGSVAVQDH